MRGLHPREVEPLSEQSKIEDVFIHALQTVIKSDAILFGTEGYLPTEEAEEMVKDDMMGLMQRNAECLSDYYMKDRDMSNLREVVIALEQQLGGCRGIDIEKLCRDVQEYQREKYVEMMEQMIVQEPEKVVLDVDKSSEMTEQVIVPESKEASSDAKRSLLEMRTEVVPDGWSSIVANALSVVEV